MIFQSSAKKSTPTKRRPVDRFNGTPVEEILQVVSSAGIWDECLSLLNLDNSLISASVPFDMWHMAWSGKDSNVTRHEK